MEKVLIISELAAGGVERVNRLLAQGLKGNYEVCFLSIKGIGKEYVSDFDYITLNEKSGRKAFFKIIKSICRIKPDYIFSCSHTDTICSIIYSKLIDRKCKSIFTVHSVYSGMFTYRKRSQLVFQHYIPKIIGLYNRCDGVVYVSQGVRNDFTKIYKINRKKEHVIYNPVFEFMPSEKKDTGVWHDPLRLVTVGRIEREKKQDILIGAVPALEKRGICSELHIYGEGSRKNELKNYAKQEGVGEKIIFEGFSAGILSKLKEYDIFVLSSEFESFGNVIVEAMGVGIPIIVYDCPVGPREILKSGMYGSLVKTNSSDYFADAIVKLMSDKDMIGKVRKARQESEQYEISYVIGNYINMLKNL